jgi:hypothetical protein
MHERHHKAHKEMNDRHLEELNTAAQGPGAEVAPGAPESGAPGMAPGAQAMATGAGGGAPGMSPAGAGPPPG